MRSPKLSLALFAVLLAACAGSTPEAESADEYGNDEPSEQGAASEDEGDEVDQNELEEESPSGEESADSQEPQFTDGMSVNDAINAVPQGMPRTNIDPETLSVPIRDPSVYQPCKLAANQHFTLKVAVWDGRAVGIDIKTQPDNEAVAACVKEQVKQIEWDDKVKSLNIVEFSF